MVEEKEEIPKTQGRKQQIEAEDIRTLATLVTEAIEIQGYNFIAAQVAEKFLRLRKIILPQAIVHLLRVVFPREKLLTGANPATLAEEYIKTNRYFRADRLFEEARRVIEENPGILYKDAARMAGIPYMTLMKRLRAEGLGKLSKTEKTLRALTGRGKSTTGKTKYAQYISKETFEKLKAIVERNKGDLTSAEQEWATITGNKPRARDLFKAIFPAYLVEKFGVSGCLEKYSAWLDTGPRKSDNRSNKQKLRDKEYAKENQDRNNKLRRKRVAKKRARDICIGFLELQLKNDWEIGNKTLFANIAKEIIDGENGVILSEKYGVSQMAIIGVRRKMLNYFSSSHDTLKGRLERGKLLALLSLTDFYATFHDDWLSPEYLPYSKYYETKHIEKENRLVTTNLSKPVYDATRDSFKPEREIELQKRKFLETIRNRTLHRPK